MYFYAASDVLSVEQSFTTIISNIKLLYYNISNVSSSIFYIRFYSLYAGITILKSIYYYLFILFYSIYLFKPHYP